MKLHTVNKSPSSEDALVQCLAVASTGAVILLMEDGVYGALRGAACSEMIVNALGLMRVCALADDVAARGLDERLLDGVELVDYSGFARLAAECDGVVSWH